MEVGLRGALVAGYQMNLVVPTVMESKLLSHDGGPDPAREVDQVIL